LEGLAWKSNILLTSFLIPGFVDDLYFLFFFNFKNFICRFLRF